MLNKEWIGCRSGWKRNLDKILSGRVLKSESGFEYYEKQRL